MHAKLVSKPAVALIIVAVTTTLVLRVRPVKTSFFNWESSRIAATYFHEAPCEGQLLPMRHERFARAAKGRNPPQMLDVEGRRQLLSGVGSTLVLHDGQKHIPGSPRPQAANQVFFFRLRCADDVRSLILNRE